MALEEASGDDLPAIVGALAEGFAEDPMFRWMFGGERYDALLHQWLEMVVAVALDKGPAYLADGDAGAALWTNLGVPLAGEEELALVSGFLTGALGGRGEEVLEALGSVGAHKPEHPPSHHLVYIAVRPDARGRGLGAQLITPLLADCDKHSAHAYLHSTNPASQPFYRALGFEPIASVAMPGAGPAVTPMWRRPR